MCRCMYGCEKEGLEGEKSRNGKGICVYVYRCVREQKRGGEKESKVNMNQKE